MSNERKHHTSEEKVAILRRHLVDRVPVSTLCDEHQLHPTAFYRWLKQFFDNGAAALGRQSATCHSSDARQRHIAVLQKQLEAREFREYEQKWMISLSQGQFGSEEVRQSIGDTVSRKDVG